MWVLLLIPSCAAAVYSCLRLVRVAAIADALAGRSPHAAHHPSGVGLYETAYLAGGPARVVDLALVRMAGVGRLHLAHTGWTTVVDPRGRGRLERALIGAIGPEGQCRTAQLKAVLAAHPTVRDIGDRLTSAGLATPAVVRDHALRAVRQVRYALVGAASMLLLTVLLTAPDGAAARTAAAWYALPLVLTGGTLLMARVDVHAYTAWAAPAGQTLLRTLPCRHAPATDDDLLTAVAISGPAAVQDPRLRAALDS
ncbi:TIGR04222 domain-containing membrane protein [Kitasatospora phosalacinea]|uniref:Membrane protein n=1 Tax=Kitasatospora phosalacinea TaxID=2065 RepID=A0A9W6PB93_9ACTN|nr:TIGR04222 domain-containing membrane protein [Kitasatospora phosalacinea]GLW52580.1 membrane protein [Kitasatospora phosalacinea]